MEGVVGVVRLDETADFEADTMSQGRVIDDVGIRRDVFFERVLVGAVAIVDQGSGRGALYGGLRLRRRVAGRNTDRAPRWSHDSINVGIPLARGSILAGHQ